MAVFLKKLSGNYGGIQIEEASVKKVATQEYDNVNDYTGFSNCLKKNTFYYIESLDPNSSKVLDSGIFYRHADLSDYEIRSLSMLHQSKPYIGLRISPFKTDQKWDESTDSLIVREFSYVTAQENPANPPKKVIIYELAITINTITPQ